jgi:CheY-like chemotaxis protein
VVGDPVRLHQIILNLVSNAVKFTTKGKITISVRLLNEDSEKVTIEFAVTDTGIGIPENKIGSLFQPFSQIDNSTTRKYGGTGLGLVICKRLVETMGGKIWAESKFGKGSTFHFTIMTKDALCKPFNEKHSSILNAELQDKRDNDLRILLAEDNIVNQKVMYRMLKKLGYRAEVAADGLEVLEALKESPYDVILMDVQMPKMDGLEATRFIRQAWPDGPKIIAITAHALKGDKEKCLEAGMDEYISKPVNKRELQKVLKSCSRISEV